MAHKRCWVWMVGCAVAACCMAASAQTFYKWTDDQGVVHFSDEPPPHMKDVEERQLPAESAAKSPPAQVRAHTGDEEDKETARAVAPQGPSRVILVSRRSPRISPSALHIIGEVKNVGGEEAHDVAVSISAVDTTQGTPCLQEQAAVTPSTLGPGESGNFDVDVDSPCLYGSPAVDVAPVWD